MNFYLTYLLASIDLISMAFFIASAVIGFLLCWIILKEKIGSLEIQHKTIKESMDRLIDEYSAYKTSVDRSLAEKDDELLKVNQLVRHHQNMSNPKLNPAYQSLEKRLEELAAENDNLKSVALAPDNTEIVKALESDLESAQIKLKKQDALLMQAKSEAFPRSNSDELIAYQKVVNKLKSKINELSQNAISVDSEILLAKNKKLKKKIKKLKKVLESNQRPQPERVEYVETLDVKKLMEMIESGTLIKRRKSKVLSTK